ncbi:biotin/lipoyl-binding protein, partial [Rubrivirga sp.]|uniref:biotin/lipoyl-binding protein n=1 Tax=Rubrivirga sp. TaxID=1885344 RepID=UPI003C76CC94
MSPTKKILIGLGVLVVLLIGAAVIMGGGEEGIEVETAEARVRTITQTVTASGTVASEVEVAISSDVSGEIIVLAVEEGDRVQQGDLLLRIRPDFYAIEADRARSQIATAQSGVGEAQSAVA